MNETVAYALGTIGLLLTAVLGLRRPEPGASRHPALVASAALLVVAALVRATLVEPTFVHADMLGAALVDDSLAFPGVATFRDSYGRYGFWIVGAFATHLGNDAHAVFRVMQVVGFLDVALLAVLVHRLGGGPFAALFTVALAATHPALMRVAASEDMHNVGLLLGLVGMIGLDAYASTRRAWPLLAGTLALCLLAHTRQTYYLWIPCAYLLALVRVGPSLLRDVDVWASGCAVLLVLVPRSQETAATQGSALPAILAVVGQPQLAPAVFRYHALFDVARFGIAPLVTLAALVGSAFGPRPMRGLLGVVLLYFVATYACAFPSPGVELAQRLPVIALALGLTGWGVAAALERYVAAPARTKVALSVAFALFVAPVFSPAARELDHLTPDYREYRAVEASLAALPREFTLVVLRLPEIMVGYSRYAGMLRRAGKRVRTVHPDERAAAPEPQLFLEGVECWSYSFRQMTGIRDELRDAPRAGIRFDRFLFGRERSPIRPPAAMQPECAALLHGATPWTDARIVRHPEDDPPFLFYATEAMPVRFHRLASPTSR